MYRAEPTAESYVLHRRPGSRTAKVGRGEERPTGRKLDGQLVCAMREGDPLAFGRLFDRWVDRLVDYITRLVCDQAIAAEVAQDVLLAAWQKLDELRDPEAFGPWLLRSARRAMRSAAEISYNFYARSAATHAAPCLGATSRIARLRGDGLVAHEPG
ncbi:MAG: putative polymerase subfamily sigma factor, partial [Acidimicrobiales bacterium]|nr:putative polymerase subfamily sigma factor [Acidimicrobiales bacterium]